MVTLYIRSLVEFFFQCFEYVIPQPLASTVSDGQWAVSDRIWLTLSVSGGDGIQYLCWGKASTLQVGLDRRKEPSLSDVLAWNRASAAQSWKEWEMLVPCTSWAETKAVDWELGREEGVLSFVATPAGSRYSVPPNWEKGVEGKQISFVCHRLPVLSKM